MKLIPFLGLLLSLRTPNVDGAPQVKPTVGILFLYNCQCNEVELSHVNVTVYICASHSTS